MDNNIKQALLNQFGAWLDAAPDQVGQSAPHETEDEAQDAAANGRALREEPGPTTDLYALFVEMAGLRTEVRAESRLVKEALDQFRGVFETLQTSHATAQQELERARAEARDQAKTAVRPLLLEVIDLRDRLLAALKIGETTRTGWSDRWFRGAQSGAAAWQEGLRLILRRLDQVLLDRRVVAMRLEGRKFDPLHARAIGTVADGGAPDGTVVEEVRSGFLWDDQVLRTAEVIVSKSGTRSGDTA